jgi:predicted nuclease with TOPRIM domain
VPKNEREWWASRTIEKLERELTETERLRFGADADRRRLRAEVERWKTVAAKMSEEREHNANEASRLRAEVERLTTKIGNQADRIRYLEGAINHATGTPLSKAIARAEKAEAAFADPHTLHAHCLRTLTEGQIAHLFGERMTAIVNRAEKAEAELADWSVLNLWGGTPEIIHEFVKGQQTRIHRCQDLEAELTALAAERDQIRAEADRLNDIINRAGVQFFHDGTDGQTAAKMLTVLNETKLLKNETPTP